MSSHDITISPSRDPAEETCLQVPTDKKESLKADNAQPGNEPDSTVLSRARHKMNGSGIQDAAYNAAKRARSKTLNGKKTRRIPSATHRGKNDSDSEDELSPTSDSDSSTSESDSDEPNESVTRNKSSHTSKKTRAGRRTRKCNRHRDKSYQASDSDTDSSTSGDSDRRQRPPRHKGRRRVEGNTAGGTQIYDQLERLELRLFQLQTSMAYGAAVPNMGVASTGVACGIPPLGTRVPQPSGSKGSVPVLPPLPSLPTTLPASSPPHPGRSGRSHRHGKSPRRAATSCDEGDTKRAKETKKGTKAEYKRVDWVWDSSRYTFKLQDTAETSTKSRYEDFIFHVRRTFDTEGKYRQTFVDVKSKLLRECLQDVIGNVRGASLVDETPKLDPNMLFLYLEDFRTHLKHLKKAEAAGDDKKERQKNRARLENKMEHLKMLIKYLDKDYAKVKESLYPMLESGVITFDLLWALWKPNTIVYGTAYGNTEDPRAFKVSMAYRQTSLMRGDFYLIEGKYLDFDGKKFGYGSVTQDIPAFHGACKITSLPCYPLKYHKDEAMIRQQLIARGRKFVAHDGVHFKSYSGIAYQKRKKNSVMRFSIQQSRIMVDPAIFRRINPNYVVSTVRPKDHDILSDDDLSCDDDSGEADCACGTADEDDSGPNIQYVSKVIKSEKGAIFVARLPKPGGEDSEERDLEPVPPKAGDKDVDTTSVNPPGADDSKANTSPKGVSVDMNTFSEENLLIASPVILGFSFAEKQWLEFSVSGIDEIKWNDKAWDSLVLETSTKDLIKALVQSRKYHAAQTVDDVIQGKGKGLVSKYLSAPRTNIHATIFLSRRRYDADTHACSCTPWPARHGEDADR
ncbi:hypothetical protein JDV02_006528 [Purpureocillium takamizusanense]|uniref:DUF7025 domain-containing protein n=1 Tax=Purpureocillium takamizusanense TaxID=2060973 RepID=A0A9Q8QJQ4_9HYPO|nr:uncharacterized protein JDV02_006528 [Purpureocillium takamizusanense]UNI20441.1 hypothetical protein JDV02_006528 [Purpureocillium takamizusanense]